MAMTSVKSSAAVQTNTGSANYGPALAVLTTLFFIWGSLTSLNDVLIPFAQNVFHLAIDASMLIQTAFFSAYFVFSIPSAKIIDWIGYKRAIIVGLSTMVAACLLFYPAARIPSFPFFLTALMILATGITALQVAANPYVAVLGPPRTAASRLNLPQAFNSLGTTIAPYIGGLLILSSAPKTIDEIRRLSAAQLQAYRLHEAASVKGPYLLFAVTLIVLALIIARFRLPVIPDAEPSSLHGVHVQTTSIWHYRHLLLGAIGIFVYVGGEVSIGSFLVNYFGQREIGNFPEKVAAGFVSYYWFSAMVGRFVGAAI